MYGHLARIGLIVPSNNTVVEPEFWRMMPEGVAAFAARILSGGLSPDAINAMVERSHRAAEELRAGDMTMIAYACLATSLMKGRGWNVEFENAVTATTGKPVVLAASATIEALKYVGAKTIALATPYPQHVNELLRGYFATDGLEVVSLHNVVAKNSLEVCRLTPDVAYNLAKQTDVPEADVVCILATDFRTIDTIDKLERELNKPVISTNQALMWKSLQICNVRADISQFGSMLRRGGS